jgi:hypothetical protein
VANGQTVLTHVAYVQKSEIALVITLLEGPCEGQVFILDTFPLTVGRKRTNKVFIKDTFVSEQHAQLYFADGHWYIKELGSSNGTVINTHKFTSEGACFICGWASRQRSWTALTNYVQMPLGNCSRAMKSSLETSQWL